MGEQAVSAQQALQERVAELQRRHPPVPAPLAPEATLPLVLHHDAKLRGTVLQDARVRTDRESGNALLIVLFKQAPSSLPVLAVLRHDSTDTSLITAHSKANRLRAGTPVRVEGEGLRLAHHRGEQVLEVVLVHSIEPPQVANTRKDLE